MRQSESYLPIHCLGRSEVQAHVTNHANCDMKQLVELFLLGDIIKVIPNAFISRVEPRVLNRYSLLARPSTPESHSGDLGSFHCES
jgi:hypothetical protein